MKNNIYGALYGGFIGDAIGVPLEFKKSPNDEEIEHAISVGGGGSHNIGKFQISDDSELQLAMMYALYETTNSDKLLDNIAQEYALWIRSNPFDSGCTCTKAFSMEPNQDKLSLAMRNGARKYNSNSKSNGSLMRLTPLILYCINMSDLHLVNMVISDTTLSHPNKTCIDCNIVYAITMKALIHDLSPEKAYSWAHVRQNDEVLSWLEISNDKDEMKYLQVGTMTIGFVKWAFILAFYHLRRKSSFLDAIVDVIRRGGDTDTNCSICSSLCGALHGYTGIPQDLIKKIEDYDSNTHGGISRPKKYSAKNLKKYAEFLSNPL